MQIFLPDLKGDFSIKAVNDGNTRVEQAKNSGFRVYPGTYLLVRKGKSSARWTSGTAIKNLKLDEFVAPTPINNDIYLTHQPFTELTAGKPIRLAAKIVGADHETKVTLYANNLAGEYKTIEMVPQTAYDFIAELPAELLSPGQLNYRIVIQKGSDYAVFPGNHKGNPFAWDNYINETWQSFIAAPNSGLELFNPSNDRNITAYPIVWRGDVKSTFISGSKPNQLIWSIAANKLSEEHTLGMQCFVADKIKGRAEELSSFNKLVIRARSGNPESLLRARITLIDKDAAAFTASVSLDSTLREIVIPFADLKPDACMLLPRPFPGFMPLWFKSSSTAPLNPLNLEKLEITIGSDVAASQFNKPYELQVESVWLAK